jgi:hypothetical protein
MPDISRSYLKVVTVTGQPSFGRLRLSILPAPGAANYAQSN